jgi:hypothetical protein
MRRTPLAKPAGDRQPQQRRGRAGGRGRPGRAAHRHAARAPGSRGPARRAATRAHRRDPHHGHLRPEDARRLPAPPRLPRTTDPARGALPAEPSPTGDAGQCARRVPRGRHGSALRRVGPRRHRGGRATPPGDPLRGEALRRASSGRPRRARAGAGALRRRSGRRPLAVARDLGLDRNTHLLVGGEEVYPVPPGESPPTFPLRARPLARPGLPGVGRERRAARPRRRGRLCRPLPQRHAPGPDAVRRRRAGTAGRRPSRRRSNGAAGPIPVGGLLRRIGCADGLLVGGCGGCGLTAHRRRPRSLPAAVGAGPAPSSTRPCAPGDGTRWSPTTEPRCARTSGDGSLLRRGLAQVRTPAVAAAGVHRAAHAGRAGAARRILFGDRSFPRPDRRSTT